MYDCFCFSEHSTTGVQMLSTSTGVDKSFMPDTERERPQEEQTNLHARKFHPLDNTFCAQESGTKGGTIHTEVNVSALKSPRMRRHECSSRGGCHGLRNRMCNA